jgi:dTDP-4-amino-4,6-dideoxygalactose transaminase
MAGLSVRSLFDLYLAVQDWEPGDRIVFTAVTVADMPRIARERGFEVATVDIDPSSTQPDLEALGAAMNSRTRAVVFTHLFGARLDVSQAAALAKRHGASFVEDCAEAYAGPDWRGHPDSDLALFSFGPIKTATALGGGLARVGDPGVLGRMREHAASYPLQTRFDFFSRCLKYGLLGMVGMPVVFGIVVRMLALLGVDHDALLQRLTRGFPGPRFFDRIRRRPAAPLLRLLARRLAQGDAPVAMRVAPAERLIGQLEGIPVPAAHARPHFHWLVSVLVDDPVAMVDCLDREGFNATRGRALSVVEDDPAVSGPGAEEARRLLDHLVFLPFSPQMPGSVLDRLAMLVRREVERQGDERNEG